MTVVESLCTRASPSGKAMASQAIIRGFESRCPLHRYLRALRGLLDESERDSMTPIPMTDQEAKIALDGLSKQIDLYAELLVKKGCALKVGQQLAVMAPIQTADFARRVQRAAYAAGAKFVTVIWTDTESSRITFDNVSVEDLSVVPAWQKEQLDGLAKEGAAFLFLEGQDPEVMKGVDPQKPAASSRARNTQCKAFREGMDFGRNVWCIAGVPVRPWAHEVFPNLSEAEALYRLWVAILDVARASGEDPESAWETHNATFEKTKRFLNSHRFDALWYQSENGTNLVVGMNKAHLWEGGAARTVDGTAFFPNIPTEEVFTSPDRLRVEGVVYSALPLIHAGQIVKNFWFRFEKGKVVEYDAEQGKDVLKSIVETDEHASYLGECALISKNTPIRQSGILFYDTLYDENASCHLALGTGFPECLEGGLEMDSKALLAHGINQSATHVDFMIGSDDMNIWGVDKDGKETPIFVNGQWAWE